MRMALWQTCGLPGDVAGNLDQLERQASAAAATGAQLLLCPELWLGGYNVPQQMNELAEAADGPSARRIGELAQRLGLLSPTATPNATLRAASRSTRCR